MKKALSLFLALTLILTAIPFAFAVNTDKPFDNSSFYKVNDDYTLHYRTYEAKGEEKNQIMLIHGFCLSTATFEGLAEIYAENGYTTVLVDVPNFGYSSRETSETTLMDREDVIYTLMDYLGGTWIAGGHSMGGGIAINLATDHPETVTGLVLFAPQTSSDASETQIPTFLQKPMQTVMEVVRTVILWFPCVIRYALVAGSFSSMEFAKDYEIEKITDPFTIKGTGAGIAIMSTHTRGSDLSKLKELDIPCVIVTADKDIVANADNLQAIIDNAPEGTKVVNFVEGGHMMMEYNPTKAAEETLPIMEKTGDGSLSS